MPKGRGIRKSIDEKIIEKELSVQQLSDKLSKEKKELNELYAQKKEQRVNQILGLIEKNNLNIDVVEEIIEKYISETSETEEAKIA